MSVYLWIGLTLLADGIAGLAGALLSDRWIRRRQHVLVAFAAGALLAAAFVDLLPESTAVLGPRALHYAFAGFVGLAIVEWTFGHHHHARSEHDAPGQVLPFSLLVSDGLHNVGDGAAIAAAFLVSPHAGVATALAVIAHEVPQEVGDYALLRGAGLSRTKALAALSAVQLTAILGALGVVIASELLVGQLTAVVVAIAAGSFLYIGATDLLPVLHSSRGRSDRRGIALGFALGLGAVALASAIPLEHRGTSVLSSGRRAHSSRSVVVNIEADELGPSQVVHIRDPRVGLEAFVVVDNVACGPAIGGLRMAVDVTIGEVFRLARAMTLKNAAAGLPHGGAKAGILGDPRMEPVRKERLIRAFAEAIAGLTSYVPGPDMGTDETAMAWLHDEIGRAVGLPRVIGGIPLDEIGATGFGLAIAASAVEDLTGVRVRGARVAVQGFGAVGRHAARFLAERGARIVAIADSKHAVVNADGFDVARAIEHKQRGGSLRELAGASVISHDDLIGVDCDVWIPAARPDVLRSDNVDRLRARFVLPGANIPATPEAERALHARGVWVLPDFVANAGGVICAAVEFHGGSQAQALAAIEEKIAVNARSTLERAIAAKTSPREAAVWLARTRIDEASRYRRRGWSA